jgi:hypothetical protein
VLITVEGVPGYWSQFSGVKESITRPEYSDGLTNRKRYAATGTSKFEDVTIARAFDPTNADDDAAYRWVQASKHGAPQNITVRPVTRAGNTTFKGTKAWYLSGALVKEYAIVEDMDTGKGDGVVMLKVTLTVDDAVWA